MKYLKVSMMKPRTTLTSLIKTVKVNEMKSEIKQKKTMAGRILLIRKVTRKTKTILKMKISKRKMIQVYKILQMKMKKKIKIIQIRRILQMKLKDLKITQMIIIIQ